MKRRPGRPPKPFLEKKRTYIRFWDFLKRGKERGGSLDPVEVFDVLFEWQPKPCRMCEYHLLIEEVRRCLGVVHRNNEKVLSRRGAHGKRQLIADLMSLWTSDDPYPFNLDLDDPHRHGWVPLGFRGPGDNKVYVDRELVGLADGIDGIDYDLVGLPREKGKYTVKFRRSRSEGRVIDLSTRVLHFGDPVADEVWESRHRGISGEGFWDVIRGNLVYIEDPGSPEEDDEVAAFLAEVNGLRSGFHIPEEGRRRGVRAESFSRIVKKRLGGSGRPDLELEAVEAKGIRRLLCSTDVLDRAVAVYLIKVAQGAEPSALEPEPTVKRASRPHMHTEEAGQVLLDAVQEDVVAVVSAWLRGRGKEIVSGNAEAEAETLSVARFLAGGLIYGDRPRDLRELLTRIGKAGGYELLASKRLDQLLRRHIEFDLYVVSWAYIELAKQIHSSHLSQDAVDIPNILTLLKSEKGPDPSAIRELGQIAQAWLRSAGELQGGINAHVGDIRALFDPFSWLMGERLLNLTTDKTMEAFEEEYATLTDEDAADTYTRQAMAASRVANRKIVNKQGRERRQGTHGVRFNWNVYDPAVHPTTLPGYLRERLPSLLDDRLAQQAPRKEGTGKLNVSLDVQAENSEGGAHSSPDLSRKILPGRCR